MRLDLPYEEDSRAEVDMNVVATDTGTLVEIQGTGEGATFPRSTLDKLLDSALAGCEQLFEIQKASAGRAVPGRAARAGSGAQEEVRCLSCERTSTGRQPQRQEARELRRVLDAAGVDGIELVGLDEVPPFPETPETGATFEENALVKARDGAAATGLPCVADDSGLEVDALNGMPGVLSARWSGTTETTTPTPRLLLAQLGDVPDERRGAAFVSACALVIPGGARPSCAASGAG